MPEPISPPQELNTIQQSLLEGEVIEALQTVYDPELPVNVYDLGLIYDIQVSPNRDVHILMTLTSPACPVAGTLPGEIEMSARGVHGIGNVTVELTWDPPYSLDRMPEHIRLDLGLL